MARTVHTQSWHSRRLRGEGFKQTTDLWRTWDSLEQDTMAQHVIHESDLVLSLLDGRAIKTLRHMASHPHLREKLGPVDEVVSMQLSGIQFDYMSYSHALAVLTVQPRLRIYKLKSNLKRNAQRFPQPDYRLYPHAEASSPEKSPEHRQDLRPGDECILGLTSLCHNLLGVVDPEADGLDQLKGDLLRQARDISKEHRSIVNSSVLRTLQYLLLGVPPEGNQAGGVSGSSNGGEVENWRTHRAIEPVRREGAMANLLQRLRDTRGSILGDEDSPNSSWRWCAFIDGKRMPWPSSLSKEWVFCVAAGLEGKFGCQMVEGLRVDATHDDIVIRFSTSRSSEDLVSQFPINQTLGVTTPARRKHLAEAAVGILLALVGEDHTEAHQYISLAPESHTPPEADAEDPSFALLNVNVQWAARLPAAEAPLFEVPRPHEAPTQTDLTAVVGTLTPWSGGCQAKASCCCSTNMVYSVDKNAVAELQSIDELVVAVSYVWDQYDDKELVITLAKLSRSTRVDKFWVDRWCINQSCQWHKEIMIPEMGLIYSNCEFVIALCPDITATLPSTRSGYLGYDDGSDDMGAAVRMQFAACRWRSRSWTWQEGVMAWNGWYMTAYELVSANTLEHWVNCSTWIVPGLCSCPFCSQTVHRAGQHVGEVTTWKQTLWVNALNDMNQFLWGELLGRRHRWSFQEAMEATCQRKATIPLDMLYSIMGAVEEVREVEVDYQADLADKLKEFVQAGDCALCLVTSRTIDRKPGACWMPEVVDNPSWKEEVNWMMRDCAASFTSDGLLLNCEDLGEVESTIETDAGLMVIGGGNTPWTIIADAECAVRPRNRAFMLRRGRDGVVVFAESAGEELWHRRASADVGGQLEWLPTHPAIAVKLG